MVAKNGGMDPSCVKQSDQNTVKAYTSMLMSDPEIGPRTGSYKREHRDIAEMSVRSMMFDLAGIMYIAATYDR